MAYNDEFTDQDLSEDQKYYRRHKKQVAQKNKKYYIKTKEKYAQRRRDSAKEYREKNKKDPEYLKKKKERARLWWLKNRDRVSAERKRKRMEAKNNGI